MTRTRIRTALTPPPSPLPTNTDLLLLLLFFLSLSPRVSVSLIDFHFGNCSLPVTCGGLNIAFLFYVRDRQPSYCGFPGFDLSFPNDRPVITLSGDDYGVRDFFYKNQSLRISNAALPDNNSAAFSSCAPGSLKSVTLPLTLFQLSLNVTDTLSLLYNCNITPRVDELLN